MNASTLTATSFVSRCRYRLQPQVAVDFGDGVALLRSRGARPLRMGDPELLAALRDLAEPADRAVPLPEATGRRLLELGAVQLEWTLDALGARVLLRATVDGARLRAGPPPRRHALHPGSSMDRDGDGLRVRNPGSPFELRLYGAGLGDGHFERASDAPDAAEQLWLQGLGELLWSAGLSDLPEAVDTTDWDLADRQFHIASRGRSDGLPRGATYRRGPKLPTVRSQAAVAPQRAHRREDLDHLQAIHFVDVLRQRRSMRGAAAPLARSAVERLLRLSFADILDDSTRAMPCKARAFASAGGMHELDVYFVAVDIEGLAPGLHRFCCETGTLLPQSAPPEPLRTMLAEARKAWGADNGVPRGLIVLCADLPLMTWRYEAIAYRLSLLNAGHASMALCQLGAALGIGLCPLGSGDAAAFAEASGWSEWQLPAIAEIAIAGAVPPIGAAVATPFLHPPRATP